MQLTAAMVSCGLPKHVLSRSVYLCYQMYSSSSSLHCLTSLPSLFSFVRLPGGDMQYPMFSWSSPSPVPSSDLLNHIYCLCLLSYSDVCFSAHLMSNAPLCCISTHYVIAKSDLFFQTRSKVTLEDVTCLENAVHLAIIRP